MNEKKAVIQFRGIRKKICKDIEIPLHISAYQLLAGLNEAYQLEADLEDVASCFLISENPIALLRGEQKLEESGVHDGSIILYTK